MLPRDAGEVVCGLVLAAGTGRRFGSVKQLSAFGGRPLLEHALAAMSSASLARFAVVLGAAADEVISAVDLHGAIPVVCERWAEGQAASLRTGIDALPGADAVVVTLGDQPLISAAAIDRVASARSPEADGARATYDGHPGHPVLLERRLLDRVPELRGDVGARELLAAARLVSVPCDGVGDPTDVDTPATLAELQGRLQGTGIESSPGGGA
jgi:molybdenum cofactor cytidylyltransferase